MAYSECIATQAAVSSSTPTFLKPVLKIIPAVRNGASQSPALSGNWERLDSFQVADTSLGGSSRCCADGLGALRIVGPINSLTRTELTCFAPTLPIHCYLTLNIILKPAVAFFLPDREYSLHIRCLFQVSKAFFNSQVMSVSGQNLLWLQPPRMLVPLTMGSRQIGWVTDSITVTGSESHQKLSSSYFTWVP